MNLLAKGEKKKKTGGKAHSLTFILLYIFFESHFLSLKNTDILVNVNFTCIWCCPIFLISHQIHGTPNTRFFMFFFPKIRRKEKRVFGVEQSLPIKLRVIGVFGKSKSCLGLGYTEACGTIRCHLKNF